MLTYAFNASITRVVKKTINNLSTVERLKFYCETDNLNELLLEIDINKNIFEENFDILIGIATISGSINILKWFLSKENCANYIMNTGISLLSLAEFYGQQNVVSLLIEYI